MTMDLLPTEILLVIVSFIVQDQASLASCNRLNKSWCQLTRNLLYKEPKINQVSAFSQFLKAVDTPLMSQYLSSLDRSHNNSNSNVINKSQRNLEAPLGNLPSPCKIQSDAHSSELSESGRDEESESLIISSMDYKPKPVPTGGLVEVFNLSMMSHRWNSVDFGYIHSLTLGCPFISTLDLRDCSQLRDDSIRQISEQLGPRNLKSLILSGCTRISDISILSLCAHAVNIENLELSGCERISDISIIELGSAIIKKDIVSRSEDPVDISDTDDHSDDTNFIGRSIIQGISRTIKSLDLSNCTRITDIGIEKLRIGATQLRSLNLEGCYGVLMNGGDFDETEWEDLYSDEDEFYSTQSTD